MDSDSWDDSQSDSSEPEDYGSLELTQTPVSYEIAPLLECPVCYDLPLPPIRTCIQGHILCVDCANKISRCPLCLQSIGNGRNYFAEEFINRSTFECKFRDQGCQTLERGGRIKEHVLNCEFRPIKCRACSTKVNVLDFESHLILEHGVSVWDINDEGRKVLEYERQLSQSRRMSRGSGTRPLNRSHQPKATDPSIMSMWKSFLVVVSLAFIKEILNSEMDLMSSVISAIHLWDICLRKFRESGCWALLRGFVEVSLEYVNKFINGLQGM